MTIWYEFVCLDCGHSGLIPSPSARRRRQLACPRCGSLHLDLQERDLAPLLDDDESGPEVVEENETR